MFLEPENLIAIAAILVTVVISLIGGIYKIVTNTKNYELTENYRKEILEWYSETVELMIRFIHYYEAGVLYSEEFNHERIAMLAKFSAQIERGRFYFPNVIEGSYGSDKPSAYRGSRNLNLEFLLYFYRNIVGEIEGCNIERLWNLERNFTSAMFDIIDPRERNQRHLDFLELTLPKDKSMADFIYSSPKDRDIFKRK